MNAATRIDRRAVFSTQALSYGTRMASAVLLAFAASAVLHLPEGFWAVMSALIVVRPDTGSTLGAGWDRVRGALVGTVLGLAATALRHVEGASEIAPLAVVTLLAFAAGLTPSLRSAPISALIVATSGSIPGHTAGQVALLRALEIGIGVAAALLVALVDLRSRATLRFRAAAAAQLRAQADALVADPAAPDREAAEAKRRTTLRQLAVLADSADREARLLARKRHRPELERHRKSARLLARLASDTALFARLRPASAGAAPGSDGVEQGAAASLHAVAEALERAQPVAPASLPLARIDCPADDDRRVALRLLADDLSALIRLEGLQPAAAS